MQRISGISYHGRSAHGGAPTMIIWTIKLLSNVRQAIAGRNHPHQLAWAVAFGLVLGLVPHGNLVALVWLVIVLSLNVNHSMAAIAAIGSSFIAGRLDPYSHRVGEYLLSQPKVHDSLVTAWQWPLVPWTDLNNTVVLGSVVISLAAMLPVFMLTYPIFRFIGRKNNAGESATVGDGDVKRSEARKSETHEIVVVDQAHKRVARPHHTLANQSRETEVALTSADFTPVADAPTSIVTGPQRHTSTQPSSNQSTSATPASSIAVETDTKQTPRKEQQIAVETRIDVIRISDYRETTKNDSSDNARDSSDSADNEPMDEAFRYLLHQLRDTQQRKAA